MFLARPYTWSVLARVHSPPLANDLSDLVSYHERDRYSYTKSVIVYAQTLQYKYMASLVTCTLGCC